MSVAVSRPEKDKFCWVPYTQTVLPLLERSLQSYTKTNQESKFTVLRRAIVDDISAQQLWALGSFMQIPHLW